MSEHVVTDAEILAALDLISALQTMAYDEDVAAGISKEVVRREQLCFLRVRARLAGFLSSPEGRQAWGAAR